MTQMTLRHLLAVSKNKKRESKDHQIYSKMWRRSVNRKPNLNFIRVIKRYSTFDYDAFSIGMGRNLSKNYMEAKSA